MEEEYKVAEIATQTTQVFVKGDKQLDIHSLLAEVANDLAVVKADVAAIKKEIGGK